MELKLIFVIFASIISCVHLRRSSKKTIKKDVYNSVYVDFPDDPCIEGKVDMPNYNRHGRRISEVKCLEYVWRIRYEQGQDIRQIQCAKLKNNWVPVLGGTDASYGEYAHMGALGWKARVGTWVFKCGGSLISEKYVLTAAHCSSVTKADQTVAELEPKIVRLGGKNIIDVVKDEPLHDVNIRRFISHRQYRSPLHYYDIALVELEEEVSFLRYVHPSCLRTNFENPPEGTVTGWGVTEAKSFKTSPDLQKADIRIIDSYECDRMLMEKRNNRTWWKLLGHQLCASDLAGRIDTCNGDSGGPLQVPIPLRGSSPLFRWKLHQIVGVTAFGFGCGQPKYPGVYTRVASFVNWIEDIVWPRQTKNVENRFWFST